MVEIAEAPVWLVELASKPPIAAREAPADVELDLPYSIEEARKWLIGKPIVGEDEPNDDYPLIARLKDFALSPQTIAALLIEAGAQDCEWLHRTIDNAWNYGQNQPGSDRPKPDTEVYAGVEVPAAVSADRPNHFKTRAQSRDEPPPVYLIEGLLQEDSDAALIAPSGHLKSFVALDLAFSVATGQDALGQFKTKKGPVLYFAGEGARSLKKKRATAWEIAHGFEPYSVADVFIADVVPLLNNPALIEQLVTDARAMLRDRPPSLFINDTLNRSLNGEDEDSASTAAKYLNTIGALRRALGGGASLTLHHSGYADSGRGRGSSAFGAGWDTELNIEAHVEAAGEHQITLAVAKQKDDDGGQRFCLRSKRIDVGDGMSLIIEPNAAPTRAPTDGDTRDRVFRFVASLLRADQYIHATNRGGAAGPRYVAQQLNIKEILVKDALVDLVVLKWLQYQAERTGSYGIDREGAGYRRGPEFGCADARKALEAPEPTETALPAPPAREPEVW